jgi:hypothetical protein
MRVADEASSRRASAKQEVPALKGYAEENAYVHSLQRHTVTARRVKSYRQDSLLWLAAAKARALAKCAVTYSYELAVGHRDLLALLRLRGSASGKTALVLGGGPSVASLSPERLARFSADGGDVFGVNLWSENASLCEVAPRYLAISDPKMLPASGLDEANERLRQYLVSHPAIKILCPIRRRKDIGQMFSPDRLICFCDSELRNWWGNINPLLPRGYVSMTLYKTLSVAIWMGYDRIYVLGMDNTYPRNVYCDRDNRILNLEIHAGRTDYTADWGDLYGGVGDLLYELAYLFYDARKFVAGGRVVNLDPYSLTDAFPKVDIDDLRVMPRRTP